MPILLLALLLLLLPGCQAGPQSAKKSKDAEVIVNVCVGPAGELIVEPKVVRSSGDEKFDNAALKLAKEGSGHYVPEMLDDKPINSCFLVSTKFKPGDPKKNVSGR